MLARIWDYLFHRHRWQTVREVPVYAHNSSPEARPIKLIYLQRCVGCGELRKTNLSS